MPDAVALATKIGRPLLGLLPEALKSFKHSYSVLFSSVPIAGASRELSLSTVRIFPFYGFSMRKKDQFYDSTSNYYRE